MAKRIEPNKKEFASWVKDVVDTFRGSRMTFTAWNVSEALRKRYPAYEISYPQVVSLVASHMAEDVDDGVWEAEVKYYVLYSPRQRGALEQVYSDLEEEQE